MIEYVAGDGSLLDTVAPLWEKMRAHHLARATHFAAEIANATFPDRRQELLKKAGEAGLHVDLARDKQADRHVGYCVTSVNREGIGEVESVYVEPKYRGRGIGETLMRRSIAWMDTRQARRKIVAVAAGNEEVVGFYERFGFFPRATLLMHKPPAPGSV
jgi:ribosomal protein S18 acetylase RimI-like enzyme